MKNATIIILIAIGLLVGIAGTVVIVKLNKRVAKTRSELAMTELYYKDKLGQQVKKTQATAQKLSDLKVLAEKDSAELSDYQKRLKWAYNNIEALNLKIKKLQEVTVITTETQGEFSTPIFIADTTIQDVFYSEYSDGYLEQYFTLDLINDTLYSNYIYNDSILVADEWVRQLNRNGKKVFFLWRFIKPWEVHIHAKSSNPNAMITNIDKVLIKKK